MPGTSIPAHRSGRARVQALRAVATGLLGLSLLAESHAAPAAQWVLDSGTLEATARFEGQPVPGRFHRFHIRFHPPRDGVPGGVRVKVDMTSLRFEISDVNRAIAGPEWLHLHRHAWAGYEGEVVESGEGHLLARGELQLKGMRHSLQVPLSWHPGEGRLEGSVTVDRTWFGIGPDDGSGVAPGVEVRFDLRLRRETP